jgi:hypothetical protein
VPGLNRAEVLECGDTVSTPYGDGLVLAQRDEDGMTAVKLQWGAVAFLSPDAVSLVLPAYQVTSRLPVSYVGCLRDSDRSGGAADRTIWKH